MYRLCLGLALSILALSGDAGGPADTMGGTIKAG
jgi:hypothetical protein